MDYKAVTIKELLEQKASAEPGDFEYSFPTAAGQEVLERPVTHVIHKTVVVHEYAAPEKAKSPTKIKAKFLLKEGVLYPEHREECGWELPEGICTVIVELIKADHRFVPTKRLFALGGYAKKNTFKSQRQRLKEWGHDKKGGGLDCNIIEGDAKHGFLIPETICIQRVPTGTR